MHSIEIEKLVISHLMTFSEFDKSHTARDNVNFTPPSQGVWVRVSIRGGISQIVGMANEPCIRENGIIYIQVFDRENVGTFAVKNHADKLALHFKPRQIDKLEWLAPSVSYIGVDTNGFIQYNVSIPYRYN